MYEELIQWLIAGGGWIVAIATVYLGYRERSKAREEERLQQTLEYFTGRTQRRNIGIALIEGVWRHKNEYLPILVPVIANQIVYLLITTESKDMAHEERNLVRLYNIFVGIPHLRTQYNHHLNDVLDAIDRNLEGEKKGLQMSSQTLKKWHTNLNDT